MRGAIALNNAAISLLEKGQATKALRVFREVVTFLQESTKKSISYEQLQQELHRAATQVASTNKKEKVLWQVQAVDDDDDTAKHEATVYGPSSSIGFALRLGDLYMDGCSLASYQYLTAAILCNFSLAYRCAYISTKRSSLLVGAAQTLQTAKFLVVSSANKAEELYELYRWQVLLGLLRQTLTQVARDARFLSENNESGVAPILRALARLQKVRDDNPEGCLVDPQEAEYINNVYRRCKNVAPAA